jgi:hypothetical protein
MLFNRVSQVPHPQALARLIEIAVYALLEVGLGEVLLELVPKESVSRVARRGEEVVVLVVRRSMSLVSSALPGCASWRSSGSQAWDHWVLSSCYPFGPLTPEPSGP